MTGDLGQPRRPLQPLRPADQSVEVDHDDQLVAVDADGRYGWADAATMSALVGAGESVLAGTTPYSVWESASVMKFIPALRLRRRG